VSTRPFLNIQINVLENHNSIKKFNCKIFEILQLFKKLKLNKENTNIKIKLKLRIVIKEKLNILIQINIKKEYNGGYVGKGIAPSLAAYAVV
jgi:hypothetical protein